MTSDYALKISAELESASRLRTAQFIFTRRPWLDLYGINVRPVAPFGSTSSKPFVDTALMHRCLPDELLFEIFARMTPYNLGKAACVCRKWRYTIRNPVFWRNACLKAWQLSGVVENYKILHSKYDGSWRKMWLLSPRIRTDGLYVSRNTYIRAGVAEWKITNPVHVVCYFRYLRFYPSGRFLYKNSSQKVKDVAKCMNIRASKVECVYSGHYTLSADKVEAAFLYPGLRPTVWRIRLRLRGTTAGANNRMDLLSLVTSGVNDSEVNSPGEDILGVVEGWQEDETHNPDVPAVSHRRGLTPFVFVSFDEVMLNLNFVHFLSESALPFMLSIIVDKTLGKERKKTEIIKQWCQPIVVVQFHISFSFPQSSQQENGALHAHFSFQSYLKPGSLRIHWVFVQNCSFTA